jgi:hypothetical protein
MGAFDPARCGVVLAAIAMTGCMEVFGVEPPPALSNAGAVSLYDGAARPTHAWPPSPEVREVRGPAVLVLQVPAGASVTVTYAQTATTTPHPSAPPSFRPSPYEEDAIPTPSPYKPSPYEDPRRPALYRAD